MPAFVASFWNTHMGQAPLPKKGKGLKGEWGKEVGSRFSLKTGRDPEGPRGGRALFGWSPALKPRPPPQVFTKGVDMNRYGSYTFNK